MAISTRAMLDAWARVYRAQTLSFWAEQGDWSPLTASTAATTALRSKAALGGAVWTLYRNVAYKQPKTVMVNNNILINFDVKLQMFWQMMINFHIKT